MLSVIMHYVCEREEREERESGDAARYVNKVKRAGMEKQWGLNPALKRSSSQNSQIIRQMGI